MPLERKPDLLSDRLQHLQVRLVEAHYTHCPPKWGELDYVPSYSKLYYICDGEGWLKINGQELYPTAGQLIYMPANVLQSYATISERTYTKYWCHFNAVMGELDLFQWLDAPYCVTMADDAAMRSLFLRLTELHRDGSYTARLREKAALLELIAAFLAESGASLRISKDRGAELERLKQIDEYLDRHLAEPLTLEQIARHVHLHPNYLVRFFNKHYAAPPLKHLNRRRMQKAKMLLGTTSLTVKEVAEQVGYPDTNHFAKAFRKESSCSPTEYRLLSRSEKPPSRL